MSSPVPFTLGQVRQTALDLLRMDENNVEQMSALTRFINMSARDVWNAHSWRERETTTVVATALPDSTGTVSISNLGTAVTGSSTAFAAMAVYSKKIALSYTSPPYVVASRGSTTALTLARAYLETAASGATFVLYADEYDVAEDVDVIRSIRVLLDGYDALTFVERDEFDRYHFIPASSGVPLLYTIAPEVSRGVYRIQVWPVPNAVVGLSVLYQRTMTDLTQDADVFLLNGNKRDLVCWHAVELAAPMANKSTIGAYYSQQYRDGLRKTIANERDVSPRVMRMQPFDAGKPPGIRVDIQA